MTDQEKTDTLQRLNERQLALMAEMQRSDAHAAKCVKLGLSFAEAYPDEAAAYAAAREEYNVNETAIADLEAAETEDPITLDDTTTINP